LIANSFGGSFTITLPATPANGSYVQITDGYNFELANVIVARNGSTIEGASNDVALDLSNTTVEFIYNGVTWDVTSTTGARGPQGPSGNTYNQTLNTDSVVTFAGVSSNTLNVKQVFESTNALSGATGTVTHDCSKGHIFVHSSISANFTANFANVTIAANNATAFTLVLNQGATPYVPTAVQIEGQAQTVNWQANTQPGGSANTKDVVSFSVVNNNGTWITLGQLTSFG
jgi:hypothetical protein